MRAVTFIDAEVVLETGNIEDETLIVLPQLEFIKNNLNDANNH